MSGHPQRGKLLGLLVLVVVVLGSIGAYLASNRPPVASATSLTSTSTEPVESTTTQIAPTSTTSAALVPIQWITISQVRPVDYYLTLLDSNGTQPYQLLGDELRMLPDLSNATAIAQITYLALNATNPEVKEALGLMMIGGTPDPEDYGYPVPSYNTELQVLYWLACQNQFKKDDTLALSIALVNGLWVTIGDEQVREAVRNDTTNLLNFFRETDQMQSSSGFHRLEDYPLEAKVALVWTGGQSVDVAKQFAASLYLQKPFPLTAYQWCVTSVDTLREMRKIIIENNWWQPDVNALEKQLIDYFWYDGLHWLYTLPGRSNVTANGVNMTDWEYGSSNYIFWQQYMKTGIVYGVSYDFLPFIDSWLKSAGVASDDVWMTMAERPRYHHFDDFVIYYDPSTGNWTANTREIGDWDLGDVPAEFILFRPPIHQESYLKHIENQRKGDTRIQAPDDVNFLNAVYVDVGWAYYPILGTSYTHGIPHSTGQDAVLHGIPNSQMAEWLLLAGKNPDSWW